LLAQLGFGLEGTAFEFDRGSTFTGLNRRLREMDVVIADVLKDRPLQSNPGFPGAGVRFISENRQGLPVSTFWRIRGFMIENMGGLQANPEGRPIRE
jgi:hypothetical protein